jgi:hypothetical protein
MIEGTIMRYQDIQLPLLTGRCTAVILLLVLLTAGCGPGKIAIAPEELLKLKEEPEIIAFRYYSTVILTKPHKPFGNIYDEYEKIEVKEEPLTPLMESFLAAIKAELKLNNIRTLQEPRHHDPEYRFRLDRSRERTPDLIHLQRTFQTGLVFDFDRDYIVFEIDSWSPHIQPVYCVHLWAKARLIRINDREILWQGVCDLHDCGLTLDDFRQPIKPLVQEELDSVIKACAQELTAQFMGK